MATRKTTRSPATRKQAERGMMPQTHGKLKPKPEMIAFATFQFDPEAAKDIDETNWPGVKMLKMQMNADMQTDDLKKKRASDESF